MAASGASLRINPLRGEAVVGTGRAFPKFDRLREDSGQVKSPIEDIQVRKCRRRVSIKRSKSIWAPGKPYCLNTGASCFLSHLADWDRMASICCWLCGSHASNRGLTHSVTIWSSPSSEEGSYCARMSASESDKPFTSTSLSQTLRSSGFHLIAAVSQF